MRGLDPDRFLREVHAAVDDNLVAALNDLVLLGVVLPDLDHTVSLIESLLGGVVVYDVGLAVIVEEEVGVDAREVQDDGVAPSFGRILCLDDHVAYAAGKLRRDHVEGVVMRVVAYGWGVDSGADARILDLELRGTVQYVAYLPPVDQILRVEDGHARVDGERRAYDVVVVALAADARVGVAALKNGRVELVLAQRVLLVDGVGARVGEVSEDRSAGLGHIPAGAR